MYSLNKKILPNGLRALVVPMKENPTVTVLVLVEAGSKYETKDMGGISHFLEHMYFKGTEKRPSALMISHELDSIGAQSNAFTSHEYTGYYAKSDAKHFKKIFDVISDIYLNSTLPKEEIEKEKGVIIEELNMYEDRPDEQANNLIMELMYGDTPVGRKIIGTKENIKSFSREDFLNYQKDHYIPESTVVIVSGNVEVDEAMKEIENSFGMLGNSSKKEKDKVIESQSAPRVKIKNRQTDQAHLILTFRSFDIYNPKKKTEKLLSVILGGGMSSRLFQKLREEMGVCYYVYSSVDSFTDHGFFSISVGCDTKRVEEVVSVLIDECKKIRDEIVTEAELTKAKEYLLGNMKLGLESSDAFANFYGGQEILHREILNPEEYENKVRGITKESINEVAKEIFRNEKVNLAIVGPYSDENSFLNLLKL